MDVTPNKGMFKAMEAFTDAVAGETPHKTDMGPGAIKRRKQRRMVMDFLHDLVRLSMREGVKRQYMAEGRPVIEDQVRPNTLAKNIRDEFAGFDSITPPH